YPVMMVVLVPLFASLADRWDRRATFVALGGSVAGASAFLVLLGGENKIIPITLMLFGLGIGQAISIAPLSGLVGELGRRLASDASENSIYGIFRLVERTGNALGPFVGGALLGAYGFAPSVMMIGGATAICATSFGVLNGLLRE